MRCRIKPTTPSCGAKQNHLIRTNHRPFAPKTPRPISSALIQSPVGTKHLSPAWQRWGKLRPLQKAPGGDTILQGRVRTATTLVSPSQNRRGLIPRANPRRICTYVFPRLQVFQNVHLQKRGGGVPPRTSLLRQGFSGQTKSGTSRRSQSLRAATNPLESYSCTNYCSNSHGIISLQKKVGARVHEALL